LTALATLSQPDEDGHLFVAVTLMTSKNFNLLNLSRNITMPVQQSGHGHVGTRKIEPNIHVST